MADTSTKNILDLKKLHQQIDDVLKYGDVREANNLSSAIKKAIKEPGLDPVIVKDLNQYLVFLNWLRILSISDETLFGLLKNNILDAYTIPEYDLQEKMKDRFDLFDFPDDASEFLERVTATLEQNTEILGEKPIPLNGQQVPATIGNWVKLYNTAATRSGQRSEFDTVQFMQKNATTLTENQKLILLEVLKIYDSGKRWLQRYNQLPQAKDNAEIPENVVLDLLYGAEEQSTQQTGAAPVPAVRPASVDGLKSQTPVSAVAPAAAAPTPAASIASPAPMESEDIVQKIKRDQVNPETASRLQALLHKAPQSQPQSQPQSTPDIDTKLEELKKRINQNSE